ncbi:MAG: EAL domain-containing protein [Burkholderiaceae bacterium]|nr:EAL domain-containing protein [Burkholderiaceae bacterium]
MPAQRRLLQRANEAIVRSFQLLLVATAIVSAVVAGASFLQANNDGLTESAVRATYTEIDPDVVHPVSIEEKLASMETAAFSPQNRDLTKNLAVLVRPEADQQLVPLVLELRMLRGKKFRFWVAYKSSSQEEPTTFEEVTGATRFAKGGMAINFTPRAPRFTIVGQIDAPIAWRPKARLWTAGAFAESIGKFERLGGALVGSFLMMAVFSALISLINSDPTFFLFSGWLVTSLRVAALNGGWDLEWLGIVLAPEHNLLFVRASLAVHGFFSIALYQSLFSSDLSARWNKLAFAAISTLFVVLAVASLFLAHGTFMRTFWVSSLVTVGYVWATLVRILVRNRSAIAKWYAASWGILVVGLISEIAFQADVLSGLSGLLNAQSGALMSSLVMGVSLAERIKKERSARLNAQAEALSALKKFEENFNSMPVGLFGTAGNGALSLFNPAFRDMFGSQLEQGKNAGLHLSRILGATTYDRLVNAAKAGDVGEIEFEIKGESKSSPSSQWFLARIREGGQGIEGSIQDISRRKRAEQQLTKLSTHDSLTELLNRRGLESALHHGISAAREGVVCAVAYINLDRFKVVNDLHGHGTGDAVLQAVAERVVAALRPTDKVARIGDSFIVVLTDLPEFAVDSLFDRVRASVCNRPFEVSGKRLSISVSIGVVALDGSMKQVDAIAAADRACSDAKARGRNTVVQLTDRDEALRTHLEELKVVADLQQKIPTDRYFLEFQPIVAMTTADLSLNYEVLIRMRGENGGIVPPGKFIGAAERNGLMSSIDRWVLASILAWLEENPAHLQKMSFATINMSGASLNDSRFVDDAFAMIADHPAVMSKLCFEITESVALHDLTSTRKFVDRVRLYGSKLALDDFGAGYTSFNYLKEIPADFIKIDGSFVRDIDQDPANYAITRTIVDLTHELGMKSIAEWAESHQTIQALIDLGVDYGQGFGLARPLDKRVVTSANSCLELIRDPVVAEMVRSRSVRQDIAKRGSFEI